MEFVKRNKGLLSLVAIIIATAILAIITPASWTIKPIVGYILLILGYMIFAGIILLYLMVKR